MSILKRNRLKELCETAIFIKQFLPGAWGKGKTHCNHGAHWIASNMKAVTSVFFGVYPAVSLTVMTANNICKNAVKLAKEGIITELLNDRFAQKEAWAGKVVLVCAQNRNYRKSGHVAIIYPTEPPDKVGIRDPVKVANIGGNNFIGTLQDNKGFNWGSKWYNDTFYPLKFYLL